MQDHLFPLGWLFSPALQLSLQFSSPNIDWCILYEPNCVHSRFFVLLLCLFVYWLIYYSLYISYIFAILKYSYIFAICSSLCAFVYL